MRHATNRLAKNASRKFVLAAAVVGLCTLPVSAANETWVGNTDTNWSTGVNWNTLLAPVNGDSLIFGVAGSSGLVLNNDLTNLTFANLTFNASASSYTLGGNAFSLSGPLTNDNGVQLINNNITLAANQILAGSNSTTVLAGQLSGLTGSLTKNGTGTVTLSGANTVTLGNLLLNGGLLQLTNPNSIYTGGAGSALTAGTLQVSAGTLTIGPNNFFPIGNTAGQTATVIVDGGNIFVNNAFGTEVGQSGNGILTITNGVYSSTDTSSIGFKIGEHQKGLVNLDGGTLAVNFFATSLDQNVGGGTLNLNGGVLSPVANNTSFMNANSTQNGLVVVQVRNGGAIFDTNGFSATVAHPLVHSTVVGDNAIDGGLTKRGAGSLTLSGVNTYTGATTVTGGKLIIDGTGNINTSSGVTVTGGTFTYNNGTAPTLIVTVNGGRVDGSGTLGTVNVTSNPLSTIGGVPNQVLTINNLTFSGAGNFDMFVTGNSPEVSVGTLSTNGAANIKINATADVWAPGNYSLVSYSSLIGSGFNAFTKGTINGLSGRQTANIANIGGAITLTIAGDTTLWTGSLDGRWTNATLSSPKNWKLATSSAATDFLTNDNATFDDSGTTTNITITDADVTPSIVIFNNSAKSYTISGPFGITGPAALNVKGGGVVTLTAPSTYSGGTNLTSGTLNINAPTAIGTGTLTIADGATINNTSGSPVTLSTNNAQIWNGNFNFQAGNLNLGTGPVTLTGNRSINSDNDAVLTVGGVISGAFGITKTGGAGTLRLTGVNTYTGATFVEGGVVEVAGGNTGTATADVQIADQGTGSMILSGGTLTTQRLIISGNTGNIGSPANGTLTQTGGLINAFQLVTVGNGSNAAPSPVTGAYNLTAGTLTIRAGGLRIADRAATSGVVTMNSGAINLFANTSIVMGNTNGAGSGTFNQEGGTVTFFSNAGTTVGGTGILNLGSAGTLPSGSIFTYNLDGGTLTVPGISANTAATNQSTSILNLNGGLLKATRNSTTWITGVKQVNLLVPAAVIDDGGFAITSTSGLSGSGGLTKQGTGTLTLNGANTYTGATNITAGTLAAGGALATSAITVGGGGRFVTTSATPVSGPVTVTSGGVNGSGIINSVTVAASAANVVANGYGNTTAPLTINNLTLSGAATLNLNVNSTTPGLITTSLIASGGAGSVTVNATNALWTSGSTYNLVSFNTLGGTGFPAFTLGTLGGLTPRQQATLVNPAGAIGVSITGGNIPIWTGGVNGNWTTAVIAEPKNWKLETGGATTDFLTADIVKFDDTATGTTTVNLSDASVSPTEVIFNNNTLNYSVNATSSALGIATGFLVKNGTGTVTLNTTNTYAGGTTVNSGMLVLGAATSVGTGTLTLNNGTLVINHSSATNAAPIVLNGGSIDSNGANAITQTATAPVALNGDITFIGTRNLSLGSGLVTLGGSGTVRTINVAANNFQIGSIPTATGFGLTKTGAGTLTIAGTATSNLSGQLNVAAGTFRIGLATFNTTSLAGSGTILNGSTTTSLLAITTIASDTFSGILNAGGTGLLNLTKNGTGSLTLTGTGTSSVNAVTVSNGLLAMLNPNTTVTGAIAVTGGSLVLSTTATSANTAAVTLSNAGYFKMTGGNITFAAGATMNNTSSMEISGGTMTLIVGGGSFFPIGQNAGQTATMLVNGGNVVVTNSFGTEVGQTGNGVFTITSGSFTNNDASNIGFKLGENVTNSVDATGIVNLDGGNLVLNRIGTSNTTGGSKFYFNGGTLTSLTGDRLASVGPPEVTFRAFLTANTSNVSFEVRNGGAKIDTQAAQVTFERPLIHSTVGGDNAIDGGLTKNGTGTLVLTGASGSSYTGTTNINAGKLVLSGSVTHSIGAIRGTNLSIEAGTTVVSSPSSGASKLDTLTIAGTTGAWTGKWDVTNNSLVVGAPDAATQATVIQTLTDQLAMGKAGGTWNGTGGITASSMTDSSFALANTVVIVDAGDLNLTSFQGLPGVNANSTILAVAHFGDATLDKKVDALDLNILASHWQQASGALWSSGDFNGDGKVDALDLNILASNWQFGVGGGLEAALASFPVFGSAAAAVPEPTSVALLALGGAALLGRRRRR